MRRARGYAPAPIPLPPGFETAPPILAMGGELENTFCLVRSGEAILSQHLGNLENAAVLAAYKNTLALYQQLFEHRAVAIAADLHPDYLSAKLARTLARERDLPLLGIQHHHAHIAAVMAERGLPRETEPVLGIAFDGSGYGENGEPWGGEFLIADYCTFERAARKETIAARFHGGFSEAIATVATQLAQQHDLSRVVLSGGVFQNPVLLSQATQRLQQQGLQVLTPHRIPANDGGLSLGQAAIAAARLMGATAPTDSR